MRLQDIKIGEEYELTYNYNTQFPKGTKIKITGKSGSYAYFNTNAYYVLPSRLKKVMDTKISITKLIANKKAEIVELQAKLNFLKESGEAQYNENTFKAYQTLKLLDNNKLTKMEKAKLISGLISK